ncbi:MAG: hypothetical protein Q7J73_01955 [Dehalococcoidales bacterium]|nr:hypothetical protein [Dehalococcoidales bacterium]
MAKPKVKKDRVLSAEDIVVLVDAKRDSTAHSELREQMEEDFQNRFALEPYVAESGHQAYTSPKPKNDFLKVLNGIQKASLTWSIAVSEKASADEREAASKGEQFLTGVFAMADRQLKAAGEPTLRESAQWIGCGRGVGVAKCLLYPDDEKETAVDLRVLDPMHCYWEKGVKDLAWCAYEYHISSVEAQERWDVDIEGDTDGSVRVLDFFNRTINAVVVTWGTPKSQQLFAKKPTPHNLGRVPFYVRFAGSMPTIFDKDHNQTLKHRAMSVWASSRNVYEPMNKQVSFFMDMVERSVDPSLEYQTADGKKALEGSPFGAFQVIRTKIGERLAPIEVPKAPQESKVILDMLDRDFQQSVAPFPLAYGIEGTTSPHSGAALSMLNDNMRSVFDPFASLVEGIFQWFCEESLRQFKLKGTTMKVQGFTKTNKFFVTSISKKDIDDGWFVQAKCEPRMPRDEAAEMQMALAASNPRGQDGRPLLSDLSIYEDVLKIQDPDSESTRIDDQMLERKILSMPEIQLKRVALKLFKQGDKENAALIMSKVQGAGQPALPPGAPQGALTAGGLPIGQPPMAPPGGPPMMPQGQPMAPQGPMPQGMPQISPQDMMIAQQIAAQLQAAGQPIPPELQMILGGMT